MSENRFSFAIKQNRPRRLWSSSLSTNVPPIPIRHQIKQYNDAFVYSLRRNVGTNALPSSTLRILYTDATIRRTMSANDISKYKKEIGGFTLQEMKRKIKGLSNRIGDKTHQKISTKIKTLLEETQEYDALVRYALETIIEDGINLLTVLDSKTVNKFQQLQCHVLVCDQILYTHQSRALVPDFLTTRLNEYKSSTITSESEFEEYQLFKRRAINLAILICAFAETQLIPKDFVRTMTNELEQDILKACSSKNDILVPVYTAIWMHTSHHMSDQQRNRILKFAKLGTKCKFELMDLKKNNAYHT